MSDENIPDVFESSAVVRVRHGDVVVFRCPQILTRDQRERATKTLNESFRDIDVLILDGGQDIAIVRPEIGAFGRLWRGMFGRPRNQHG